MKENWPGAIIVFFIVLFVYTKLAGPIPFFINSVNTTKTDLFTSNGEGKVTAVPDQATVDVGVTNQSQTVSDAKNKVNQTADKIITDLKKLGIADKDIKTTDYSINPNYSNEVVPVMGGSGQQAITGYTVTQNLEVKVKPIDKANKVVDTATADGANLVGGINFTFSDDLQKTLDQQATQQAVNDAKDKAQSLANVSGIHLGKIVNVVENSNQPRPLMMSAGIAGSNAVQTSTPPTNVTPGENSLTVDVVLYYETY